MPFQISPSLATLPTAFAAACRQARSDSELFERCLDVLVQPFQRRVLTYSPDNPSGWQVEMGNVGRHYYLWRYGEDLPS